MTKGTDRRKSIRVLFIVFKSILYRIGVTVDSYTIREKLNTSMIKKIKNKKIVRVTSVNGIRFGSHSTDIVLGLCRNETNTEATEHSLSRQVNRNERRAFIDKTLTRSSLLDTLKWVIRFTSLKSDQPVCMGGNVN